MRYQNVTDEKADNVYETRVEGEQRAAKNNGQKPFFRTFCQVSLRIVYFKIRSLRDSTIIEVHHDTVLHAVTLQVHQGENERGKGYLHCSIMPQTLFKFGKLMHFTSLLFVALLFQCSQTVVLCFLNRGASRLSVVTKPRTTNSKGTSLAASTYPHVQEAVIFNGILGTVLSTRKQSTLTQAGILHATALGTTLWSLLDFQGWLVCIFYFAFGSLATKVKMLEKEVRDEILAHYCLLVTLQAYS